MLLVTMVVVSLLTFAAFDLISGSPAEIMLGTQATEERVAELEAELDWTALPGTVLLSWLAGFFTGDLGTSYSYHQPVWELIAPKVGVTAVAVCHQLPADRGGSLPLGLWAGPQIRRCAGCRRHCSQPAVHGGAAVFHRRPSVLDLQHLPSTSLSTASFLIWGRTWRVR